MLNKNILRGKMIERSDQLQALIRSIDAVVHDAQVLRQQIAAERADMEKHIELSLQRSEAAQSQAP